jgi:hypothetical protein
MPADQITVENRDYHHLSQTEIAGAKGFLDIYPTFCRIQD